MIEIRSETTNATTINHINEPRSHKSNVKTQTHIHTQESASSLQNPYTIEAAQSHPRKYTNIQALIRWTTFFALAR